MLIVNQYNLMLEKLDVKITFLHENLEEYVFYIRTLWVC